MRSFTPSLLRRGNFFPPLLRRDGVRGVFSVRLNVIFFAVRTRRLVERTREDAGKRLLRIKPVAQTDVVHPLVRFTQILRRQQQFTLANKTPQPLALVFHKNTLQMPFGIPRVAGDLFNAQRLMKIIVNPFDDSIDDL